LSVGVVTFAFSTAIGWCYYGERAVEYLAGKRTMLVYRLVYLISVFLGSVVGLSLVWNIADCMNALMAIPNLLSLVFLSGVLVSETRKYLWSNKLDEYSEE
ncbi:MAG: alanine:cation symporter family protein, partial [Prevotella sp.]